METLNSKKFIIIMLIVLVWVGLSGCSPTTGEPTDEQPVNTTKESREPDRALEENSGPADFEGIVDVLGCMFAPDDCPLKNRKEEQQLDR